MRGASLRSIEDDDGPALVGPVHELLKLLARGGGAGRVVRRAEVDNVGLRRRLQVGEEVVGRVARHVDNVLEVLALLDASLAHNDGSVDIDGVRRVLHSGGDTRTEHHLQPPNVTLGAVRDEDLIWLNASVIQLCGDTRAELGDALLGPVASVPFGSAQLARALRQALEDVRRDGPR
eukprot:scaffold207096_cov36-Tisochrysis_lutea.AAC.1